MRRKSWGQYNKSFLDKVLEKCRLFRVTKHIDADSIVLDLGCGYNAGLLNYFSTKIKRGVGIDIAVTGKLKNKNIILLEGDVGNDIKLKSSSFDIITALALIEHIENPSKMLQEAHRLLKKNGVLLLTTPSKKSKPLLEFLAFKLEVINKEEIQDHKQYYSKNSLIKVLASSGFDKKKIETRAFQAGFNLFVRATK